MTAIAPVIILADSSRRSAGIAESKMIMTAKRPNEMQDKYGSFLREKMKDSMSEPAGAWRATNRLNRRRRDPFFYVTSWVVGILAVMALGLVVVFELIRRLH